MIAVFVFRHVAVEYLFRCCDKPMPSFYGKEFYRDPSIRTLATAMDTLVDLRTSQSVVAQVPLDTNSSFGAMLNSPEECGVVSASVAASLPSGVSSCVRLAAKNQPMFDILIDEKVRCDHYHLRTLIQCKWSLRAAQAEARLNRLISQQLVPFIGT